MLIKKFEAADLKEAMAMVKNELGSDAVILHTKRFRKRGFMGLKSKEVVEVTAAIDDTPQSARTAAPAEKPKAAPQQAVVAKPATKPAASTLPPRKVLAQYRTAGTAVGVAKAKVAEQAARRPVQSPAVQPAYVPQQAQVLPQTSIYPQGPQPLYTDEDDFAGDDFGGELTMADLQRLAPETLPNSTPLPPLPSETVTGQPAKTRRKRVKAQSVPAEQVRAVDEPAEESDKIQALEEELAQMREMLKQVMNQKNDEPEMITLQNALEAQDVNETVMQDIRHQIKPNDILAEKNSPEALKALSAYLHDNVKMSDGIILKDGKAKVVALIGTTGVGKTTTLAKIAAKFVLERGVSAALITADTYRISAVDQLKTYSDIIGLPLEIVYSPAELKAALRKFRNKQLVLIDTAGRSQNNEYQMQELKELLAVDSNIEKHLVLSATTKERDALVMLERFSECQPDRVMFTKTDETDSVGALLNLLFARKLTLSYLTNGQSVPDDIAPAKPETLAKLLLR